MLPGIVQCTLDVASVIPLSGVTLQYPLLMRVFEVSTGWGRLISANSQVLGVHVECTLCEGGDSVRHLHWTRGGDDMHHQMPAGSLAEVAKLILSRGMVVVGRGRIMS